MSEIKNRLAEALVIKNIKQVELSERTGLSQSQINSWKRNRWQPKQTPLHKMAKVLDVSELWLAGYDVPMDRPVEQKKADELTELIEEIRRNEQLRKLFLNINNLNPDQFTAIESMVNQLTLLNK